MKIPPFLLERYFAKYEFNAPYLLSPSDCEPFTLQEMLEMASPKSRQLWERLWLGYTESQGLPALREAIASLYDNLSAADILTLVPEEGIFIAMNVLLEPGDHVVTTFPAYQSLYQIAKSSACRVSSWLPRFDGGRAVFELSDLEALLEDNTRLLVINFPNNPTGALPDRQTFERLMSLAEERGITVFSDEMYRGLEYQPEQRLPSVCERLKHAVSLSGVSKTYSLPGLRIGWLATRDEQLYDQLATFKDYTTICSSAPGEILSLIALQNSEQIIIRNLDIISSNLDLLDNFFANYPELFKWQRPQAGSIAFPEYIGPGTVDDLCAELIEAQGVMLAPGSAFDFPGSRFRVGFGRRNLPEALLRLKTFLNDRR